VVPSHSDLYGLARYVVMRTKEPTELTGPSMGTVYNVPSSRRLLAASGGDYTSDHNAALYSSIVFAERAIVKDYGIYGVERSDLRWKLSTQVPGAHRSGDPARYGVADLIIYDVVRKDAWVYDAKPVSVLGRPTQLASAEDQVARYAQNIRRVPMFKDYTAETGPYALPSTTPKSGNVIYVYSVDDDGLRFYKILNTPRRPPVRVPVPDPKEVAKALEILLAIAATLSGRKGSSGGRPTPSPGPIPSPTGFTVP
jgi:hypothetical protein